MAAGLRYNVDDAVAAGTENSRKKLCSLLSVTSTYNFPCRDGLKPNVMTGSVLSAMSDSIRSTG